MVKYNQRKQLQIFTLKQKLRRKPVNIKLICDRFVDLFQINERGLDLYCNHVSALSIYPSMDKFEMLIDHICTLCDIFVNCRTTLESSYSSEMFKLVNQLKVSCQSTVRRCRVKLVHRTQSHITLELGKTLSKIESSEFSRASLDEYITKERREAQRKERKHIEIKYSMYTSHNARSK